MPKARQKKRRDRKRVVETALPKKQYKRTNRLLYVFSGILLVVFGGGAALLGTGTPRVPQSTPVPAPVVSTQIGTPVAQQTPTGATATPIPGTPGAATPAPATPGSATPVPTASVPASPTATP